MQININGVNYNYPSSLMAISLQQRIDFDNKYGKDIRKKLEKITEITDPVVKETEFTGYHMELACKTLAFFANIPLHIVEQTDIRQVLLVYHNTMKNFSEDVDFANKDQDVQYMFEWNGATWKISAPELTNNSTMTFGEFITAKQVVQDMIEYGQEKYGALLKLCCVYCRKEGEAFDESFVDEEGERYKLMKTLPLQYGLNTGFFFLNTMRTWIDTFLFSGNHEVREPVLV